MASVCGSTLSLMDAGVPIHAPVAGVAMGLILDLSIELPVYQRDVLYAFNSKVINADSLPSESEMNPYSSPLDRIWEVEFAG